MEIATHIYFVRIYGTNIYKYTFTDYFRQLIYILDICSANIKRKQSINKFIRVVLKINYIESFTKMSSSHYFRVF